MPMDLSRVIQAAAEAALQDQSSGQQPASKANDKRKKGLTTPRALLLGAGAFTVGRLFMGSRGRDMLGDLQERLAIYESEHFGSGEPEGDEDLDEDEEFDEPEGEYDDEAPEDEAPEDDEPEDEYDEDEATEDDEPEGEYDEDEEPEGEYDEDEDAEGEYDEDEEPEGEYDEDEEPEGEYDEDEDEESEPKRPRQRRTSSAGSHNGRH